MSDYEILINGDLAVTVRFGEEVSETLGARVRALCDGLRQYKGRGITDLIPAFASLTIVYDPRVLSYGKLCRLVAAAVKKGQTTESGVKRVHLIPVAYGGEYGPDLADVARLHGVTEGEVVALHAGRDYRIYMLGFLPGFPYLGGLDERLTTPRLDTPRTLISAGSVGIGGNQTGMYPTASPGGWRLIGRTPEILYDAFRTPPVEYAAGEYIRFYPVSAAEYAALEREIAAGTYRHRVTEVEK